MGYVFDFKDSSNYDTWFNQAGNRSAFKLEINMMMKMLDPKPGSRLLDIGCGTGKSLEPFLDKELLLTGMDPSPYMLDLAGQRLGHRADLHRGFGEDLPFEDNSFDHAIIFTSLEFTNRPAKVMEEACRVARKKVFIGTLNRWAPINLLRKVKGWFFPSIYSSCRLFSIWELRQILEAILGQVPIAWRTTPQLPWTNDLITAFMERQFLVQKSPFGTIIGMVIHPVPKIRTRPLFLKLKEAGSYRQVTEYARQIFQDEHEDTIISKIE